MAQAPIPFRFSYEPEDESSRLDAYDAGQALYGISRSLAIVTHYVVHGKVIKQAPALSGAKVVVIPPQPGSFQFLLDIIPMAAAIAKDVPAHIAAHFLYDLAKLIYRRCTGLRDAPETTELSDLLRRAPGDVDALTDAIDEDVIRIHRPFEGPMTVLNIYGGTNHFGDFNHTTYAYAKARELGDAGEEFVGDVASYNGNTDTGRVWLPEEQRTVGFKRDRGIKRLPQPDRMLLSWSLDEYVNQRNGTILLTGRGLRNRERQLKIIFVTNVSTVRSPFE
jgi:hypothetical protein